MEFRTNWNRYRSFIDEKSLRIHMASMFLPDHIEWTIIPIGARKFTALIICDESERKVIRKCKGFMILTIGTYEGDAEDAEDPTG